MVSRSLAAGKTSMPPTASIVSGNTSVWLAPARSASCSAALSGTADACGVKASNPAGRPAGGAVAAPGPAAALSPLCRSAKKITASTRDQQDGALQQQRRTVDGQCMQDRIAARGIELPGAR